MIDHLPTGRALPPNSAIGRLCPLLALSVQEDLRTVRSALDSLNGFLVAGGGPAWSFLPETLEALKRIQDRLEGQVPR